jgi:type III pantothenate kinase
MSNAILFEHVPGKNFMLDSMEKIVLTLDVGNTQAKARPARAAGLCGDTLAVSGHKDFDAVAWAGFLERAAAGSGPSALVWASVVPAADALLRRAAADLGWDALAVPGDLPLPLENRYARPAEVGADRLVGSFAARRLFPDQERLVVVDFGTATTFDCVAGDAFLGGLICPGLLSASRALHEETAKLPLPTLELNSPDLHIGLSTMDSMNQGLLFGAAAQVEGLTRRLAGVMGGEVFVLATGGLAGQVARVCPVIQAVLPDLLAEGLALAYFESAGA